ncbi:tRNA synthetases class I-domain-containing protein [Endogone sp. FLAS-F59071]|nr:tRNA synthetases class I-domain-containing protein [Endogone sp. FLAS-F59071]|eukprot:RUS17877.1 tRNA synthetases class I-domain-containing protein [Endogone sp. FLAS-F59071]
MEPSNNHLQQTEAQPASGSASETATPEGAKSKNADKNEAKRLAKLAKFQQKQATKQEAPKANATPKEKKVKAEKAPEPEFVNTTPPGEKKDMFQSIASGYNPHAVESAWYAWWEKEGFFKPQFGPDGKPKPEGIFVVPAPPPNITGSLHIGHALTVAIQDSLVRWCVLWNRMQGKTVLFNPGTDHAGVSCQSVVENRLWREQKKTRHDLGREAFVAEVWKWKEKYGGRIYEQFKRLGSSYDWDRAAFTMDPKLSKAVRETFVRLHEEGIIYRANRLVNWCVRLNTTLSNLEVENKELAGRTLLSVPGYDADEKFEFGVIVQFAYQVENSGGLFLPQPLSRVVHAYLTGNIIRWAAFLFPEFYRKQMRGLLLPLPVWKQCWVTLPLPFTHRIRAMRYHLHGKFVIHPFVDRRIPIVIDDILVDPAFGTGAVKVTPAHDFNDYEVGKRHNLEFVNILNDDGIFNENAGPFKGYRRFHARKAVAEALKEKGLYVDTKDNPMTVPVCSKSGDIIEPLMKPQWWVNCKDMADEAMQAVTDGKLKIQPKTSEQEWFRWLGGIQDWCVSRQVWWGHRIPAYFVKLEGITLQDYSDDQYWVSGQEEAIAYEKAKAKFPGQKFTLEQGIRRFAVARVVGRMTLFNLDPDVLDTWFSSGLWPFSIFGWPDDTEDLRAFYPTSLLETGWDILFFWVARMVMLGIKLTNQVPFSQIFCHAMIRDAHGRKMSKSLGNVVDPIDVIEGISLEAMHQKLYEGNLDSREIEKAKAGQQADYPNGIPECGTDALRFALCAYTSTGRDINLDILRVEGYRKFCNKLWNATRFALMKLGDDFQPRTDAKLTGNESLADRWILSKLNNASIEVNKALHDNNFMSATNVVYQFWIYELCDVFIEISKPAIDSNQSIPENVTRKRSAQDTLYTCLEAGLKLLHPFMPFVTEELYQRLARRQGDSIPTISLAKYPVEEPSYSDLEAERDFDLVFSVVKAARSLIVEYNIQSNAKNTKLYDVFHSQEQSIVTLIKECNEATAVAPSGEVPPGCALTTISEDINVLLLVKGFVDIDAEVTKFQKKLDNTNKALEILQKKKSIPDYKNKVPVEIREANETKARVDGCAKSYQAEIEALALSIQNFLKLKDS